MGARAQRPFSLRLVKGAYWEDEALAIANGVRYALTGSISRSPAAIARVRREFRVGHLYINRGITGALVERQAFGGFKMSGVGSKAWRGRLPAAVPRAAGDHREHAAPRVRPSRGAGRRGSLSDFLSVG